MFHVVDHAGVVYAGELSQVTQYVIEHYGNELDDAIRSGIRIGYTDVIRNGTPQSLLDRMVPDFRKPFEDWQEVD